MPVAKRDLCLCSAVDDLDIVRQMMKFALQPVNNLTYFLLYRPTRPTSGLIMSTTCPARLIILYNIIRLRIQ